MAYYREVLDQRVALLKLLTEQGKLTDELQARIESCFTKAELDDLHHQFRPGRKTRAAEAIEKGLEPWPNISGTRKPMPGASKSTSTFRGSIKGVTTQEQALQGAVDIIAEWIWANFEYRKSSA